MPIGEGCPPSIIRCFLFIYFENFLASLPHNSQTEGPAVLPPIYLIRDMVKSFHISEWLPYLYISFLSTFFGGLCGHVRAVLSRRTPCPAHFLTLPLSRSTGKPSKATSKNMCSTAGTKRGFSTWNATPVALSFCGVGSWPKITTLTSSGSTSSKALNNHGICGSMASFSCFPFLIRSSAKRSNKETPLDFFCSSLKKGFHRFGIQFFKYLGPSILSLLYLTSPHHADLTKQSKEKEGIKMNNWMNKKINSNLSRATRTLRNRIPG